MTHRRQLAAGRDRGSPRPAAGHRRAGAARPGSRAGRADRLLRGEWEVLGVVGPTWQPDWFRDPVTAAGPTRTLRLPDRPPLGGAGGNVKQVWELSRLQHLTLLATAWFLTRDERYASRVADHLRSWWRENPFLSGVHWTSGIELGIRLISLAWIRRLLDDWPGVADLFERDALALRQIRWHQQYLAAFRSRGSSANNHVIAEAAGQLVASCAFPWFPESERWRRKSALLLERELIRNTFPSGIGRELASDYQCFVAELGLVAAVEAEVSGHPLRADGLGAALCAMADSAAALVDERMRPPRQGDSDEGRGLLLDAPAPNRWPSLLALAGALVGRLDWWPQPPADADSAIVGALAGRQAPDRGQAAQRPSRFADAGIDAAAHHAGKMRSGADATAARTDTSASPRMPTPMPCPSRCATRVWILADPGTTVTTVSARGVILPVDDRAQHRRDRGRASPARRPFMWVRHARAREIEVIDDGDIARWTAEHDGYASLDPPAPASPLGAARPGVAQHRHHRRDRRRTATTSAWPSISDPTSTWNSKSPCASWTGPRHR